MFNQAKCQQIFNKQIREWMEKRIEFKKILLNVNVEKNQKLGDCAVKCGGFF